MTHPIRFAKMEGAGNDFVVVPSEHLDGFDPGKAAIKLCARNFGIGADGLLTVGLSKDPSTSFEFRMYNPDGSADMCGNGLRCATLFAQQSGLLLAVTGDITIDTYAGKYKAEIVSLGHRECSATIRVRMGVPQFTPAEIPFTGAGDDMIVDYPLNAGDVPVMITAVNTGSTHCVVFNKELPGDSEFQTLSPLIENHPSFPERTSIMWATQATPTEFFVRIWERAASETLACGTGACAVAAAACIKGLAEFGSDIDVQSKGGDLKIHWPDRESPIFLTGPARWVYEGQLDLGK